MTVGCLWDSMFPASLPSFLLLSPVDSRHNFLTWKSLIVLWIIFLGTSRILVSPQPLLPCLFPRGWGMDFHSSVPSSWQGCSWSKCLQKLWQSQDWHPRCPRFQVCVFLLLISACSLSCEKRPAVQIYHSLALLGASFFLSATTSAFHLRKGRVALVYANIFQAKVPREHSLFLSSSHLH